MDCSQHLVTEYTFPVVLYRQLSISYNAVDLTSKENPIALELTFHEVIGKD